MYTTKTLHTLSLAGLLALPMAAQARTINLFETEDGHQVVPANANPLAAEKASFAEFAALSIEDIIKMEVNGKPVTVQLHVPRETVKDDRWNGYEIVVFSAEYPEGIVRSELDKPLDNPLDKPDVSQVPLPAAAWLLMSGLAGMTMIARRRRQGKAVA